LRLYGSFAVISARPIRGWAGWIAWTIPRISVRDGHDR
jgi:hypothetical protein